MSQLVTLEAYSLVIQARLAQAKLQGAGITAFLIDESVASIDPFLINAIGGVKLQVRLEDEEAARRLLTELADDDTVDDDIDPAAPRCPMCDSEYVFFFFFLGVPTVRELWACDRCGHKGAPDQFARAAPNKEPSPNEEPRSKAAAQPAPTFRLLRQYGLAGGVIGLTVGMLLTVVFIEQIGVWGFIFGTVIGTMVGRTRRYAVCSYPSCRARLRKDERTCSGCKRRILGSVKTEGGHHIQLAEWRRNRERALADDSPG